MEQRKSTLEEEIKNDNNRRNFSDAEYILIIKLFDGTMTREEFVIVWDSLHFGISSSSSFAKKSLNDILYAISDMNLRIGMGLRSHLPSLGSENYAIYSAKVKEFDEKRKRQKPFVEWLIQHYDL